MNTLHNAIYAKEIEINEITKNLTSKQLAASPCGRVTLFTQHIIGISVWNILIMAIIEAASEICSSQ